MATQAKIKINSVAGSNTDLPLNTLVALSNDGLGGETTWNWTLLSQPAGTTVTLSTPTSATASFTPTKEGSYLLQLVVNQGQADEKTDKVVAAVRELETRSRIPAAGETIEVDSSTGWANAAVSEILQRVTRLEDNGFLVGKAGEVLTPLKVVHVSDATEIGVLPADQRTVPTFEIAYANITGHLYGMLGVYIQTVAGGATAALNDLVRVMTQGPLSNITLGGSASAGDPVYVDNTGSISLTPGTNSRQVGTIAHVHGAGIYDVWVSGFGGASGAPAGPAGGVLGYAGSTYPNPNGLAADSSDNIRIAPYAGNTSVTFVGDANSGGDGTSLSLAAGAAPGASGNGGSIELDAGNANSGPGGAIQLFSGTGTTAGEINIYTGTSTVGVGANCTIAAGLSTTSTGGALYARGGATVAAGATAGAIYVSGGSVTSTGTGGAAILSGGTSSAGAAVGGKITLAGATTTPLKTGDVTIETGSAVTVGMSSGSISILTGNGGTAGTAGSISLTAGDSTQNSTAADGGSVTVQAGTNATANGQGGSVVLQAGVGGTATGASLTLVGGKNTNESSARLIGGNASSTSTTGGAIVITSGNGSTNAIGPGAVSLNVGTNAGTATADISIGTSGALGSVIVGKSNVPVKVSGKLVETPLTQALTSNSDQIVVQSGVTRVTAALVGINLTSTPTLSTTNIDAGTRVLIFNAGSNSVTFNNDPNTPNTKLKLGANSRVLAAGGILELIYMADSTNTYYWYEIAFRG